MRLPGASGHRQPVSAHLRADPTTLASVQQLGGAHQPHHTRKHIWIRSLSVSFPGGADQLDEPTMTAAQMERGPPKRLKAEGCETASSVRAVLLEPIIV